MDIEEADRHFIRAYNRSVTFTRGEGVYLYDDRGRKYLDMGAGIAVSALGYGNEEYNNGLKEQIDKIIHVSNLFYNEPAVKAAGYLAEASGLEKVFFTNSGAEAVEGAIKLARKYAYLKNNKSGGKIIAMDRSFHGRTIGALSVTGNSHYREPFEPLMGGVSFAVYNDLESVKELVSADTCAIILETIQGEGGIHLASAEFLQGIKKLCDENDILLILDEIQCGMGRTGKYFAYQRYGVMPDIMVCAKALGCGVPVGAFAANEKAAAAMRPGDHGTTYGGNPLAAAAVCKVFEIFEKKDILKHVDEMGKYLRGSLNSLKDRHPDAIKEVRGVGLIQGIEIAEPVSPIVLDALEKGLVLIPAGENVIRFVPPFVIEKKHVDEMYGILDEIFKMRGVS